MRRFGVLSALLVILSTPAVVEASAPATELPEVVVTGTRTQTQLDEATQAVTVIDGREIAQPGTTAGSEPLRGTPGGRHCAVGLSIPRRLKYSSTFFAAHG